MNGLQRVQVFGLKIPPVGTPKAKRRYLVRWRVDGRDRMRSFKTRAEADWFRSRLLVEVTAGTGLWGTLPSEGRSGLLEALSNSAGGAG